MRTGGDTVAHLTHVQELEGLHLEPEVAVHGEQDQIGGLRAHGMRPEPKYDTAGSAKYIQVGRLPRQLCRRTISPKAVMTIYYPKEFRLIWFTA